MSKIFLPAWCILFACHLGLLIQPVFAQQPSLRLDFERKITLPDTSVVYVEPHLSADPISKDHIIIVSAVVDPRKDSLLQPISFVSFDNGKTFTVYCSPVSDAVDVWCSIGDSGKVYFSSLMTKGGYIYMHQSADGGRTYSQPIAPFGRRHDHETLVTDRSNGPYNGETYLVSVRDATDGNTDYGDIYVSRTNKKGTTFSFYNSYRFTNLQLNTYTPVITREGELIIPFGTFAKKSLMGTERLENSISWTIRSQDGGKTFLPPSLISIKGRFGFPVMAIDLSDHYPNRLYFVKTHNDSGQIFLYYSPDKGDTWSSGNVIHTYTHPHPQYSGVPQLSVNNKGSLAMAWMERSAKEGSCQNLFLAVSVDGGQTFSAPLKVNSQMSCSTPGRNGWAARRWSNGGDYFGLAAKADGSFHLVWSDSRSGKFVLYQAQISLK